MFDFETTLNGIEYKVRKLIYENSQLKAELLSSTEKNEDLTEKNKQQEEKIKQLTEENQIIKLRNTLVQKGDSAEIKLKINQMIRNIDKSLSLLTKVE